MWPLVERRDVRPSFVLPAAFCGNEVDVDGLLGNEDGTFDVLPAEVELDATTIDDVVGTAMEGGGFSFVIFGVGG